MPVHSNLRWQGRSRTRHADACCWHASSYGTHFNRPQIVDSFKCSGPSRCTATSTLPIPGQPMQACLSLPIVSTTTGPHTCHRRATCGLHASSVRCNCVTDSQWVHIPLWRNSAKLALLAEYWCHIMPCFAQWPVKNSSPRDRPRRHMTQQVLA